MTVKVISLLDRYDEVVLRNHQYYARLYGYTHQSIETRMYPHAHLKVTYKYNYLLQQLKSMDEGDIVMMIDHHSVVFCPIDVNVLMSGRDSVVVNGPTDVDAADIPMTNFLLVRNTAVIRATLHEILAALHGVLGSQDHPDEEVLLQKFSVLGINTGIGDTYINVDWRINDWFKSKIFVVFLGASNSWTDDGRTMRQKVRHMTHDANLERLLMRQINDHFIEGKPMMQAPNYPAISDDAVSHFNPEAKIALVTLYTHHITTYARVSEHNVKRYCDRHGYAYHVYRAIPEELDPNINGTWVKSWLLKNNIANHDWIIWVDADVLFRNQIQKLEPLLEGRDVLFAKDLCAWPINAGIMGFRNTPANVELIDKIWQRMLEVNDKSTVYSDQGDQFHTINVLGDNGILNEKNIVNCLSINTAPPMSTPATFLTHYVGWGEPYRSVYMAHDDMLSQRQHG